MSDQENTSSASNQNSNIPTNNAMQPSSPDVKIISTNPTQFRFVAMQDGTTKLQAGFQTITQDGVSIDWSDVPVVSE